MKEDAQKEFAFSKEDFERVRRTLYQKAGINLTDTKDSLVYSRLARRLRALSLNSFDDYLTYLKRTPEEDENFINALTTNLTSFFRESHHFEALAEYLRSHPGERTIWCAASSTGEEPYSIAMTVAEVFESFDTPISIIASDIDSNVFKGTSGCVQRRCNKQIVGGAVQKIFASGKGAKQRESQGCP